MRVDRHDLLYRGLVWAAPLTRNRVSGRMWDRAWARLSSRIDVTRRVSMRLHGREAIINVGNPYPAFARRWPSYNMPLVAVVNEVGRVLQRPVTLVDVGAAIGDTVLLVRERCPGVMGAVHCVEGDPEFLEILRANTAGLAEVYVHAGMVAEAQLDVPTLVRTHAGTASPQGSESRRATTLDLLLAGTEPIDIVKIDTDGFDGRVLAGADAILGEARPVVVFEWHPKLCLATDTPWTLAFDTLVAHGYRTAVWFTKFGTFDHIGELGDRTSLATLAALCLEDLGPAPDWHYDVVALPSESTISGNDLVDAVSKLGGCRGRR